MRDKISCWLVKLAYKIQPKSNIVKQFWLDSIMDYMIHGKTITRFDYEKTYEEGQHEQKTTKSK